MFTNPYGSLVIQTSFVCPLLFILSNYLLKYSILEPNKTQCSVCLKFIHRNTISRHMKNLHGDSPRVQCQHCEKICKNLTSYKDHLRRDHSIYQSNWCQLRKNSNKNTWESLPVRLNLKYLSQESGSSRARFNVLIATRRFTRTVWTDTWRIYTDLLKVSSVNIVRRTLRTQTLCKTIRAGSVNMCLESVTVNMQTEIKISLFPFFDLWPVSSRGSGAVQVLWKVASQKGVKETREGCAWEWGRCVWIWASVSSLWKTL